MIDELVPWLGSYETEAWGEGICPTGVKIRFRERITFRRGDEWVHYDDRAVAEDGTTLHTETGVIRSGRDGTFDISLVMNSGRVELGTATIEASVLRTHSTTFHNDRLGVKATAREFTLTDTGCDKHLWLANGRWPELTHHMWGELTRSADE